MPRLWRRARRERKLPDSELLAKARALVGSDKMKLDAKGRTVQLLQPGMKLEGVVTNVANFGAFVDIGVHQDGLVHVSQLADRFVRDPREVVKAGDIVSVTVVDIDLPRKRIALSMKRQPTLDAADAAKSARTESAPARTETRGPQPPSPTPRSAPRPASPATSLAAAHRPEGFRRRYRIRRMPVTPRWTW